MKTNPNNLVFPFEEKHYGQGGVRVLKNHSGINIREYFAAIALSGLSVQAIPGRHNNFTDKSNAVMQAKCAVALADALIDELNKEKKDV